MTLRSLCQEWRWPGGGSVLVACMLAGGACRQHGPEVTHISARPVPPTASLPPGRHELGLGLGKAVYRGMRRDGTLYVPTRMAPGTPVPLLVLLHGGGGQARDFDFMFPIVEEFGVTLLTLDARHNTWDGVDSPFGPDVLFIDEALRYTFEHAAIDPSRVALGGLSDGGMYALSIGRINGDLFTHLIAVAPGSWLRRPRLSERRVCFSHTAPGTRCTARQAAGTSCCPSCARPVTTSRISNSTARTSSPRRWRGPR